MDGAFDSLPINPDIKSKAAVSFWQDCPGFLFILAFKSSAEIPENQFFEESRFSKPFRQTFDLLENYISYS